MASISISGPRTRFDDTLDDFTRNVRKASEEILLKLGYRGATLTLGAEARVPATTRSPGSPGGPRP